MPNKITTKDIEENRDRIENLQKSTQGYGRTIDKLINPEIKAIDYGKWNVSSRNIHNTLFSLKGNDVKEKVNIGDLIYSAMSNDSINHTNIQDIIDGRLRMNKEFDYLITSMPELGTSLRALADDVVYGNTVLNSSIKLNFKGGNESADDQYDQYEKFFRPMANISATLHAKKMFNYDIDRETKELVFNLGVYGYQIIAQIPYTKIVNDLLYYKEGNKGIKYFNQYRENFELDKAKVAFSENYNSELNNTKNKVEIPQHLRISEAKTILDITNTKVEDIKEKMKSIINPLPYTTSDIDEVEAYIESISIESEVSPVQNKASDLSDLINIGENDTIEVMRQKRNKKFNIDNIKGSTYDVLDVNKVVPIFIKNELLGVYVIEEQADNNNGVKIGITLQNILGGTNKNRNDKFGNGNDAYLDNLKGLVLSDIANVLNRNIDKKFLRNNPNLIEDIEFILAQFDSDAIYNSRVRFISAEYLTLFTIGPGLLGTSLLVYAKEYANMYINLLKADVMQKMFYQTDRYKVLVTNNGDRSTHGLIAKSLSAIRMSLPRPSDAAIPDIATSGGQFPRFYISPVTEDGKELFTMEKMDISPSMDNTEYLKQLRNAATGTIGYPADLLDPSQTVDFAKKITNINMNTLVKVVGIQRDLVLPLSELCTKRLKFSTGNNKLEVTVSIDPPGELSSNVTSESMDKVTAQLDMFDRLIDNDPSIDEMVKAKLKTNIATISLSPYIDTDLIKKEKQNIILNGNLDKEGSN